MKQFSATDMIFDPQLTSIFLICFRSEAPYLVPYFPATPTFLVRFVIFRKRMECARLAEGRDRGVLSDSDVQQEVWR